MAIRFTQLPLEGALLIEPEPIEDARGFFARMWCRREAAAQGIDCQWVQSSVSFNKHHGTLRGLHYQLAPWEEHKLIRCVAGAVYDVIVDLRPDSSTYGKWTAVELTAQDRRQIYIPAGFAHGFQTLVDNTELHYQISQEYHPECARGLAWNDPALGIPWPDCQTRHLAARDQTWPGLPARDAA